MITRHQKERFLEELWGHYAANARSMPWRDDHSPYRVLVSEIMLQQTGVERVRAKFIEFMSAFPTVGDLAKADLADVLRAWQGLGYNRRARYLYEAAKAVAAAGSFPVTFEGLTALPGVGCNTAGAILAYAFDTRAAFVETNVRTVFFHHFFDGQSDVSDRDVLAALEEVLPDEGYREFYWALMDYGTFLKRERGGRLDASRHYKKQAPLEGSVRQVRGQIVRRLADRPITESELRHELAADERFGPALAGLVRDGLVSEKGGQLTLAGDGPGN